MSTIPLPVSDFPFDSGFLTSTSDSPWTLSSSQAAVHSQTSSRVRAWRCARGGSGPRSLEKKKKIRWRPGPGRSARRATRLRSFCRGDEDYDATIRLGLRLTRKSARTVSPTSVFCGGLEIARTSAPRFSGFADRAFNRCRVRSRPNVAGVRAYDWPAVANSRSRPCRVGGRADPCPCRETSSARDGGAGYYFRSLAHDCAKRSRRLLPGVLRRSEAEISRWRPPVHRRDRGYRAVADAALIPVDNLCRVCRRRSDARVPRTLNGARSAPRHSGPASDGRLFRVVYSISLFVESWTATAG